MSDLHPGQDPDEDDVARPERPGMAVVWGLVALVAAAVIVGGVLSIGASVASKASGLGGGGGGGGGTSTQAETLVIPDPTDTGGTPSQYITLSDLPEPETPDSTFSETPEAPETEITLSSAQATVGQMQPIDLNGTYTGGDGAVLRVQQFEAGQWGDFPVTIPVNGTDFSTFIQTGALGPNRFRVIDTDTGLASNEVTVTIS
ncbi:hypothetical protein [Nocardioides litoris]|uniref:hypothetical protein n=1 Tax=Nocardioides litoris TaxID=1926648 RepID=UPI00111EF149|nr:hypothetical protein [Nocardioides litoris]